MPGQVDAQAADAQVRVAIAGDPAQLRTHARFEFVQCERLDQVVIGAKVEHAHALGQAIAGGHHQHRQAIAALAQALQNVAAIQLRQAQVQHQQRVLGRAQRGVGVRAVVDVVDHMALPAQRGAQAGGDIRVVFSNQNAHARGSCNGLARRMDGGPSRLPRVAANRVKVERAGAVGRGRAFRPFSPAGPARPAPAASANRPAGHG